MFIFQILNFDNKFTYCSTDLICLVRVVENGTTNIRYEHYKPYTNNDTQANHLER